MVPNHVELCVRQPCRYPGPKIPCAEARVVQPVRTYIRLSLCCKSIVPAGCMRACTRSQTRSEILEDLTYATHCSREILDQISARSRSEALVGLGISCLVNALMSASEQSLCASSFAGMDLKSRRWFHRRRGGRARSAWPRKILGYPGQKEYNDPHHAASAVEQLRTALRGIPEPGGADGSRSMGPAYGQAGIRIMVNPTTDTLYRHAGIERENSRKCAGTWTRIPGSVWMDEGFCGPAGE
nr:hypothetical protein CFP56_10040 [Quercus suber]